jgi:lipoate-protein ligase A
MDSLRVYRSSGPASRDLAFESDMLDRAAAGDCSLMVSSWSGPVVVLGYGQPVEDVDLEWCRNHGVPVLRRLSGGTGVIHRGDLSVALALPGSHPWAREIVGLYDRFLELLVPALRELGSRAERVSEPQRATRVRSPICFFDQLADTLLVDGRKAVGCSQARRKGGVLIHAAVLLGLEPTLYRRVFGVDEGQVADGLAPAFDGVDWRSAADSVVRAAALALTLDPTDDDQPAPGAAAVSRYLEKRWSPVADDGILPPSAKLV